MSECDHGYIKEHKRHCKDCEINDLEEKLARQTEISIKALEVLEYITTRNLIKAWTCDHGSFQELKTKINKLNRLTGNSEVVNE